MRIRKVIASLLLSVVLGGYVVAQEDSPQPQSPPQIDPNQPWRVLFYPLDDRDAPNKINESVRLGFMPVGFEITPGESLAVLLARSESISIRGWVIVDYDDWNALEGEITNGIENGMVPMDISRYGDVLAVLWVETDLVVEGWRISTSHNTVSERTKTVNDFQSRGFTLWGMSVNDDLAWYLFLRQPGLPPAGAVTSMAKDAQALQEGLVRASQDGWAPNGMAVSKDNFYICFVR